jgi:hypothetical protein
MMMTTVIIPPRTAMAFSLSLLVPMAFVESRNLEKHGPFLSDYFD